MSTRTGNYNSKRKAERIGAGGSTKMYKPPIEKPLGPWKVPIFDLPKLIHPCNCQKQPEPRRPEHEKPPRSKSKKSDCCAQLLDILSKMPGGKDVKLHKPKQTTSVKTANICGALPVKDAFVPMLLLFLHRFLLKKTPANSFETEIQTFLASLPKEKLDALKIGLDTYDDLPEEKRNCIFETRFDDADVETLLDPEFILKVLFEEATRLGRHHIFGNADPLSSPAGLRPWAHPLRTRVVGYERSGEFNLPITQPIIGPWPWICAVSPGNDKRFYFKNQDVLINSPGGDVKRDDYEFMKECTSVPDGLGGVRVSCDYKYKAESNDPSFRYVPGTLLGVEIEKRYDYDYNGRTILLRVPTTYPGQTVALKGFNFFSNNCKVRLRKVDGGFQDLILTCDVIRDKSVPVLKDGKTVPTCEVNDVLTFNIPQTVPSGLNDLDLPPGRYSVTVIVPNDVGYAPEEGIPPAEFESLNDVWLDMSPNPDLTYGIWTDEGRCVTETDGMGSDEPWFHAFFTRFVPDGSQVVPSLQSIQIIKTEEDIDSGTTLPMSRAQLFRDKLKIGEVGAIALIGLEVDSEDSARDQVTEFADAYGEYMRTFIFQLGRDAGGGAVAKGIDTLLTTGGVSPWLWGGGIGLVVVFGVGLLYASWAPADPIAMDFVLFNAVSLYSLTDPEKAIPPPVTGSAAQHFSGGLSTEVFPREPKKVSAGGTEAEYAEERHYYASDEGSHYYLVFKVGRPGL
jgi:hypothetical protein